MLQLLIFFLQSFFLFQLFFLIFFDQLLFFSLFFISLIFISFCSSVASANEKFCLDKEGFIYPLFEEVKCNTDENEKEKTKNEFLYLIDLEGKLRVSKLEELKKNPEILKKVEEENTVVKK